MISSCQFNRIVPGTPIAEWRDPTSCRAHWEYGVITRVDPVGASGYWQCYSVPIGEKRFYVDFPLAKGCERITDDPHIWLCCVNCHRVYDEHIKGKCLFGSTHYSDGSDK